MSAISKHMVLFGVFEKLNNYTTHPIYGFFYRTKIKYWVNLMFECALASQIWNYCNKWAILNVN